MHGANLRVAFGKVSNAQRLCGGEDGEHAGLGREVQHPSHGAEKVGLALQVKHHQPMPANDRHPTHMRFPPRRNTAMPRSLH